MFAMATPYDRYKQQGVLTANPVELIVMLYDGCIKKLKFAALAIQENNHERANEHLQRAEEIILELVNSLDFHYPIAQELLHLYDFMLSQIIKTNMEKDPAYIQGVISLLASLRETWQQVARENRGALELMED